MQNRIKTFLSDFGDLLVVWPSANYGQSLVYGNTIEKRTKSTWDRVGRNLRNAMNSYDEEKRSH